mmetsp:Transcript_8156/g.8089  ORF Transcript_8156/g.8089 Transcript_8156/m.8089 type:complete len:676 (-) Transcript_8156:115-2142(-)
MPLFGHSKRKKTSLSPPLSSASDLLGVEVSNASASSGQGSAAGKPKSKIKSLLKPKNSSTDKLEQKLQNVKLDDDEKVEDIRKQRLNKRTSTIVEAEVDEANQNVDSGFDSEYDSSDLDDLDSDSDDSDYEEEHLHAIKIRGKSLSIQSNIVSQLSNIMGYCGITSTATNPDTLAALANEELKRTFSLLDQTMKIHRLSGTSNRKDPKLTESVIGDKQVQLIEKLQIKLDEVLSLKDLSSELIQCLRHGKTVYDRYGVVRDIIGRGAYGLIKIIDPNATDATLKSTTKIAPGNVFYAVKELQKRPGTDVKQKESQKQFIDRVISEFIVSSTLNYKHIVKTVDLMVTLPPICSKKGANELSQCVKISQVMECTTGGDLFTYMSTTTDKGNQPIRSVSLDEVDCFIKQISKGLWYMHQHGVAHCDLKLENILVNYLPPDSQDPLRTRIVLKLSDFGKVNVFKTKWDQQEQLIPYANGPVGSEPYMAPEEHFGKMNKTGGYSAKSKDNWALGIVILVLFNISKQYFTHNKLDGDDDKPAEYSGIFDEYSSGYLWQSTDMKMHHLKKTEEKKYRDKVFEEYTKNRMIADYDNTTKEWLIKKEGRFRPIENLFVIPKDEDDEGTGGFECQLDDDELQLCELRKMFIYKLLDPNPETRLTSDEFIRGDWMTSVYNCYDCIN